MGKAQIIAVAAIAAAAITDGGAATAQTGDVQVVRGGQSASIVETQEAAVQVFRGVAATTTAPSFSQIADAATAGEVISSGSRIWFVDHAARKLRVCRLVKTTQVGEHRIDCHARGLPR